MASGRCSASLAPLLALAAALSGCSSLPARQEQIPTTAFADTGDTPLGVLAAASLDEAGPGESGFRLLPTGDFAMDGRLTLARRAALSLDVQYYHLENDSVGLQFLRELRDAAKRGVRIRLLVDDLYTGGEDALFCSFAALPNVEVRLFNPLPSRGGGVASRILASLHEFSRINLRMHNKLFIADNRFSISGGPQHGRGVLHAKLRGQLHRHGRHRGGTGRPRAVASVRSLLEQQRGPPGAGGRRGDG